MEVKDSHPYNILLDVYFVLLHTYLAHKYTVVA